MEEPSTLQQPKGGCGLHDKLVLLHRQLVVLGQPLPQTSNVDEQSVVSLNRQLVVVGQPLPQTSNVNETVGGLPHASTALHAVAPEGLGIQ